MKVGQPNFILQRFLTYTTLENSELLSLNTSLRTLNIENINIWQSTVFDAHALPFVTWIPALLDKIVSPHIQMISFEIKLSRVEELDVLDWEAMAQIFSRPQFAQLTRINFKVSALKKEATHWIRDGLPGCAHRGILRISQPTPRKEEF